MGLVRVILAMAVASAHTTPVLGYRIFQGYGWVSVSAFFIISGFYMALIIDTNYSLKDGWVKRFYASRFFRLYPTYAAAFVLSLIVYAHTGYYYHFWGESPPLSTHQIAEVMSSLPVWGVVCFLFGTFTMFFQDFFLFVYVSPETGHLFIPQGIGIPTLGFPIHHFSYFSEPAMEAVAHGAFALQRLNPVPITWSISVEILFYLLAPFLVRRQTRTILTGIFLTLLLTYFRGLFVGWSIMFSLCFWIADNMILFLTGVLCYRLYVRAKSWSWSVSAGKVALGLVILCAVLFHTIPAPLIMRYLLFITLLSLSIPFLFLWTRHSAWDKFLAELSYPIYMCHLVCAAVFQYVILRYVSLPAETILVMTACVALLIARLVERPVDRWRHKVWGSSSWKQAPVDRQAVANGQLSAPNQEAGAC